jgi:AraC-like DNA-binding protein
MKTPSIADVNPEFEINVPSAGAIRYVEHGYPSPLVRWHCHDAYELHYIVASSGKAFVGDYIGEFHPGNLVLVGPRLPHNWISTTDAGESYALRDMVVQFNRSSIENLANLIPETRELLPLLDAARFGIEFPSMSQRAEDYLRAIRDQSGPTRFAYFCQLMHEMAKCPDARTLSTVPMESHADADGLDKIDQVVKYVMQHYQEDISLEKMAAMLRMNESYFSRFFKRSTSNTFSDFLTQIRIGKACELLSNSDQQITSICFEVGYKNVANFNRRFLERKKLTPREYRRQTQQRLTRGEAQAEPADA